MPTVQARLFDEAMLAAYLESKKAGYHATAFHQMIVTLGGVETAKRLIPRMTEGFVRLYGMDRLTLTAEWLVIQPQYASLFTEEERTIARTRLQSCGMLELRA